MKASSLENVRVYGSSVILAETPEELLLALRNTGPHLKKGEVINTTETEQKVLDECLEKAA